MTDRSVETRDRDHVHESDEPPIVIDAQRARAGRKGVPVLYVLLVSTTLVVVAFAMVYLAFFHHIR